MIRDVVLTTVTVATVALSGCAPEPMTKADVDGRIVCNTDQMAEVERSARRENKEIHWLHCPQAVLRAM